jgi:hypothetical protein
LERPILGLVHPESPAAALIRDSQAGWVPGFEDTDYLAKIMTDIYQAWVLKKPILKIKSEVIAGYSRERQTRELAEIIEGVSPK